MLTAIQWTNTRIITSKCELTQRASHLFHAAWAHDLHQRRAPGFHAFTGTGTAVCNPRESRQACAFVAGHTKRRQDGPRARSSSFRSRAAAVYGCWPLRHSDPETPTQPRDARVQWWARVSAAGTWRSEQGALALTKSAPVRIPPSCSSSLHSSSRLPCWSAWPAVDLPRSALRYVLSHQNYTQRHADSPPRRKPQVSS